MRLVNFIPYHITNVPVVASCIMFIRLKIISIQLFRRITKSAIHLICHLCFACMVPLKPLRHKHMKKKKTPMVSAGIWCGGIWVCSCPVLTFSSSTWKPPTPTHCLSPQRQKQVYCCDRCVQRNTHDIIVQ